MLLLAAALLCAVPSSVNACVCRKIPLSELFAKAKHVFVGTAIAQFDSLAGAEFPSSSDPIAYTFSVEMTWKGVDTDTFVVQSPRSGSSCAYRFEIGTQYVVLTHDQNGLASTDMCSGNSVFNDAFDAQYVLPEPTLVDPTAVWSAVSRDDLLEHLRTKDERSAAAARLLADEVIPPRYFMMSLVNLFLFTPGQSANVLASGRDSTWVAAAFVEIGNQLLDSESSAERVAAMGGLGILTQAEDLNGLLSRGFTDPAEPVRAAARSILIARYGDLSLDQADEQVALFMTSIDSGPKETLWVRIHQLRYFPNQRDRILPYLDALQDTSSIEIVRRYAGEVYEDLTCIQEARGQ